MMSMNDDSTRCGSCDEWTHADEQQHDPMIEVESKWGNYFVHVEDCFDPKTEMVVNAEDLDLVRTLKGWQ